MGTSPTSSSLSSQRRTLAIYRYFIAVLSAARLVVALKVEVMNFCDGFIGLSGTLIFIMVHRGSSLSIFL